MDKRPNLQTLLENLLGSKNVYFQPPASVRMRYPAIIYTRTAVDTVYANNLPYLNFIAYKITLIDEDPENETIKKLLALPNCQFETHYESDNLNHDVFKLYY